MKITPDIIQSITPVIIGLIGGVIGTCALFANISDRKFSTAMGISGAAISASAGLTQLPNKL